MKKNMLMLAMIILLAGCGKEDANAPQTSRTPEDSGNITVTEDIAAAEDNENSVTETTGQENAETAQNDIPEQVDRESLSEYMASVKEQSDAIKTSLEQDPLTQTDLNMKSQELYTLWDDALNYLWGEVKGSLSEDESAKLLEEQRLWIAEKEKAVEEAGTEFEGGSMHALVVNSEAARLTEERVYELYELLK